MTLIEADDIRNVSAAARGRRRVLQRLLPPVFAIAASIGVWWLVTAVLSAPHSLLRQTVPFKVVAAVGDLYSRGVLLPDAGISLWRLLRVCSSG
jgi:NitT/TauT family transport system permease protein